jgi:Cu2+-exporting ATPase
MSTGAAMQAMAAGAAGDAAALDVAPYVRPAGDGRHMLHLMVDGVHCGGCVSRIERALLADPAVASARVNLTTRRLAVTWQGPEGIARRLMATLAGLGFRPVPYDPEQIKGGDDAAERQLLRAMAVAGFAAGNIMLLSVSVWAGHVQGMGPATRTLLHWFSALIALPAVVYAGRPFFRSAWAALRHKRTNMDVPISVGIVLACAMSLFETVRGGEHAYFDSAVMLLFFLLVGRYLDRRARGRARGAAERLLALDVGAVTVLDPDGRQRALPAAQVTPGAKVLAAAGERIGVDGRVIDGVSEVDTSLITGETVPQAVRPGDPVFAGTLNLGAPLKLEVSATGESTLLAEIVRLMELAEQRRARYVVLADRVARLYAPAVHGLALATFLGWLLIVGAPWQVALLYAVAVLIITCPCALGLAVPAVQVIGSGRLLRRGILLKSATALERLAQVDLVVFDKTGTLTLGRPTLDRNDPIDDRALALAASLAAASRHPLARALATAAPDVPAADGVVEVPGAGLRWRHPEGEVRLGSRAFCGVHDADDACGPELWLARPGAPPVAFRFRDALRADAAAVVAQLRARGVDVELLSGDRAPIVASVARALGIEGWRPACTPAAKTARLQTLAATGRRVLMVGDGLNDAPALAAAHVSLSPASAVDISQNAADAVFQGDRLEPVVEVLEVAGRAHRLIRQNLALALAYNVLAVPLAVLGFATPLIAALCMSGSSLLVVGNALRLGWRRA